MTQLKEIKLLWEDRERWIDVLGDHAQAPHKHVLELIAMVEEAETKLAKINEQLESDRWNTRRDTTVGKIIHDLLDNYEDIVQ
jgi:hypothetical protein